MISCSRPPRGDGALALSKAWRKVRAEAVLPPDSRIARICATRLLRTSP